MIPGETVVCRASPSLALIKYWGKQENGNNIPATTSLAVNIDRFLSETLVRINPHKKDEIWVNGEKENHPRYLNYFNNLRKKLKVPFFFHAVSFNNFPTAAGLASSSSGFAALTCACVRASGKQIPTAEISALARVGSASAARSVFGGFVILRAGATSAEQIYPADYWPNLRLIIAAVADKPKPISSRSAMERVRATSPFYPNWVRASNEIADRALAALKLKDLRELGMAMRSSYLKMFATMFAADPPIIYWLPKSLEIIRFCEDLRQEGLEVWETMDAGPQVKIVCLEKDIRSIVKKIKNKIKGIKIFSVQPGGEPFILGSKYGN